MTLHDYLSDPNSKYAVIRTESYASDVVAQSISSTPRQFNLDGISFTLLSLDPAQVPDLALYASQVGNGIEFDFTVGSGRVSLLLHHQALNLLSGIPQD